MRPPALLTAVLLLSSFACKAGEAEPKAVNDPAPELEPEPEPEPEAPEPEAPEPAEPKLALSEPATKLADEVDRARYQADLTFIAATRPPGSDHWQAVQDHCAASLERSGFTVTRVTGEKAGTSVVGRKPGSDPELPAIVVGAHYDHIAACPGADDNASGTAAVLELAHVLGAHDWDHTLYVACWDEEETGRNGSQLWADRAVADGQKIALYLNFDAIAYADHTPNSQALPPGIDIVFAKQLAELKAREYRADFIAVLADDGAHQPCQHYLAHAARLELPAALIEIPSGLKNEPMLSDLRRSDHASFWKHDIPAIFLSDTANFRTDTYHCEVRQDEVDTLDIEFAVNVTRAAIGMLAEVL